MITQDYLTISPAYGRDYKSAKDAEADFRAGRDFQMDSLGQSGSYCSIRDFATGTTVNIRYKRLTLVKPVKV